MHVLFNDVIQYSDAPEEIKNQSLTITMLNEDGIYEFINGGFADAIYDLLDAEHADSPYSGDIDGGSADATFDDEFDGGVAVYINDEIEGGHASVIFDETIFGGNALNTKEFEIKLHEPSTINCFGVGNTDSKLISIILIDILDDVFFETHEFTRNGLYMFEKEYKNIKQINLIFSGTYIGRVGTGYAINLKTSIPKEPTLVSTAKPRVTLSGQVITGLGGYNYWRVSLDTRYKIDKEKLNEIIKGFPTLSKGFPLFVSFEEEKRRLPFERLYVNDRNQQELSFESSINKTLFSRRWNFEERF
jgi:hypothetical protein